MHSTAPGPHSATHTIHLVGGPLDGADMEAPEHASEMTFEDDAYFGDENHTIPLSGEAYYYSIYLTVANQRPTFRHRSLAWNFGAR